MVLVETASPDREKSPESVISVDKKSNFGRDLFHPQENPITNKQLHELTTATMKKIPQYEIKLMEDDQYRLGVVKDGLYKRRDEDIGEFQNAMEEHIQENKR